jgi:hypothetical protein
MHLTRRFQVLVPRAKCTHGDCGFKDGGRLDDLIGLVAAHVRETGHSVRLVEASAVIYGPAAEMAGAR